MGMDGVGWKDRTEWSERSGWYEWRVGLTEGDWYSRARVVVGVAG